MQNEEDGWVGVAGSTLRRIPPSRRPDTEGAFIPLSFEAQTVYQETEMTIKTTLAALALILVTASSTLAQPTPRRICDNPVITTASDNLYFMVSDSCAGTRAIRWADLVSGLSSGGDSSVAGFISSGALTCGASTSGKMLVHTTPLQYCDNAGTPTLRYAAYGNSSGDPTGAHSTLSGLTSGDPHTQYTLLAGRSGGQTLTGGTASGNSLTLRSTSNATKGNVIFGAAGTTVYDEVNERVGVGVAAPTAEIDIDKTSTGAVLLRIQNDSAGTAASARVQIMNDSANSLFMMMNSSASTNTAGGVTVANWAQITSSSSASGIVAGTVGAFPLVLMTNNAERLRVDSAGHVIHKMAASPTATCTGAGSGNSVTVTGTDNAFIATITTGTSPSAVGNCTVTFASAFTAPPVMTCMLVAGATAWAAASTIMLATESATAPVLSWRNAPSGSTAILTASTTYKFSCVNVGI
jgi:hypothetical protein